MRIRNVVVLLIFTFGCNLNVWATGGEQNPLIESSKSSEEIGYKSLLKIYDNRTSGFPIIFSLEFIYKKASQWTGDCYSDVLRLYQGNEYTFDRTYYYHRVEKIQINKLTLNRRNKIEILLI